MSRIAKTCSWCGGAIPDSMRLSPEEIRRVYAEEAVAKEKLEALEEKRAAQEGKKAIQELTAEAVIKQVFRHLE
jgi:hypothetical protein